MGGEIGGGWSSMKGEKLDSGVELKREKKLADGVQWE